MTAVDLPVTRIRPSRGWISLDLGSLWPYRELVGFLVMREIRVRYKQTLLGVVWIALHPLAQTMVFTVIFGMLARVPSDGLPYSVFALSGLVPWIFFASALSRGATSLVSSASLISKVYFPRLIVPIASVLSPVVDVGVALAVLLILAAYFGIFPTLAILSVVPLLLLAVLAALGVSLWLSELNVRYRDVTHTLPIATQLWFYATPVIYPASLIPEKWRAWMGLNPMATVAEGFRWAVLGKAPPPAQMVVLSIVVVTVLLVSGAYAFRRMEKSFADLV